MSCQAVRKQDSKFLVTPDSITQDITVKHHWMCCKMNTQNLNKICESSCYVSLQEKTMKCLLLHGG
jgi:hypothetical protein